MKNYVIEYEIVYPLTGNRSKRDRTVQPIPAESAYNAIALLGQKYGDDSRSYLDIYSVEEIN